MDVTYIFHSSFLVETQQCYYLFDYFRGTLPRLNPHKPIVALASHGHEDHYSPSVFSLLEEMGMEQISAVLSEDIPRRSYPAGIDTLTVKAHETYTLPRGEALTTLLSTDEGVAFLLSCPEGAIYHAGDLNDWVWKDETQAYNRQMTRNFRREIDLLAGSPVDIAFLPLDPRQEDNAFRGILYFLRQVKAGLIYPMHYWEKPRIIDRFLLEYPTYSGIIMHTE